MSRFGTKHQQCNKKVAHANRPAAHAAASRLANERGVAFGMLRIYRCPFEPFPHWHVGHKRPGKRVQR